jgi:alpha-1,2-mannosyltransferase
VCVCVLGGLVGWPFAGLAAVPLGLQALLSAGILPTLTVALLAAAAALLPSLAFDTAFYGRLTLSAWNLVKYNVVGGESGRYGTEGPLFYLLNLFNSFNLALILALVAPLVRCRADAAPSSLVTSFPAAVQAEVLCALAARRRPRLPLLVVLSSFHLWLGAMSSIPHKEERFMYVVYPQLCLGAALSLDMLCELGASPVVRRLTSQGRPAAAAVAALLTTGAEEGFDSKVLDCLPDPLSTTRQASRSCPPSAVLL